LTFSESIADVGNIDPTKFRLSSGGYYVNGDGTWYWDGGYYIGQAMVVTSVTNDGNDDKILTLEFNITTDDICGYMSDWANQNAFSDVDFYMTYTIMGGNDVEDLAGNDLENIAAFWAETPNDLSEVVGGKFAAMNPEVPIPCPN
jgi:hypothetical protein